MRKKEEKMMETQHSGLTLERGKEGKRKRKERKKCTADRTVCYKKVPPPPPASAVSRCILWRGSMTKAMGFALNKSLWARLTV